MGHRGDTDMSFNASKRKSFDVVEHGREWQSKGQNLNSVTDVKSVDHPRGDMKFFYGPTDRKVYIGGSNKTKRAEFKRHAKYVMSENFTREEVLEMGPLYLSVGGQSRGAAGTCRREWGAPHITHKTGVPRNPHMIFIGPDFITDNGVLVHELVHAKRFGMNADEINDRDRLEKMTELETMARVNPAQFQKIGDAGYYWYIPEVQKAYKTDWQEGVKLKRRFQQEDRKLILGSGKKRKMKGRSLSDKVEEVYAQCHISRAHFSPGEKVDRYFVIKKGKQEIHEQSRYIKPISDREAKKALKEYYGSDAVIYEMQDGKRVKL